MACETRYQKYSVCNVYTHAYPCPPPATPQAIDGCFVDTSCSSPATEGSFTDAESCCIADSPLAYSVGGACTECIGEPG